MMIVRDEVGTIETALASLLSQTTSDWECVIIDDASTDGTAELLQSLTDPRFRVVRSETPLGRGAARQKAISQARGLYITTLDGDDFFYPEKLERQSCVLDENPQLTATATGFFLFEQGGKPLGKAVGYLSPGFRTLPPTIQHLRVPFAPIMFRASHIGESSYQKTFLRSEDQDFFTRILMGRQVYISDDHLYAYRWQFLASNVLAGLKQGEHFYLSSFKCSPFRSMLYFAYTRLKYVLYSIVVKLGLWEPLKRIRYKKATREEQKEFLELLQRFSSRQATDSKAKHRSEV